MLYHPELLRTPLGLQVQIIILAMILLAAFTPWALHMDRLDRLTETEQTQAGEH